MGQMHFDMTQRPDFWVFNRGTLSMVVYNDTSFGAMPRCQSPSNVHFSPESCKQPELYAAA